MGLLMVTVSVLSLLLMVAVKSFVVLFSLVKGAPGFCIVQVRFVVRNGQ